MRHGILGAGGVGGLIGAVLANAAEQVTLIVRPGTEPDHPRELSLESKFGKISAPVSITAKADGPLDVLWITVKATQLESALQSIPARAKIEFVVPLLNGIDHVDRLRGRFGNKNVIAATIAVETERIAPGKIIHRSPFVRFNMSSLGHDRLGATVALFQRFGFDCKFVDDETTLLWSKLVFLAPVALTTSAGRCAIGEVVQNPASLSQLDQCVREACEVATAAGGKVDANSVLASIKALPPQMRSSMEKDIANRRAPELDAIGGPIIRGGQKYGIAVPTTGALINAIQTNL